MMTRGRFRRAGSVGSGPHAEVVERTPQIAVGIGDNELTAGLGWSLHLPAAAALRDVHPVPALPMAVHGAPGSGRWLPPPRGVGPGHLPGGAATAGHHDHIGVEVGQDAYATGHRIRRSATRNRHRPAHQSPVVSRGLEERVEVRGAGGPGTGQDPDASGTVRQHQALLGGCLTESTSWSM
jgi:hypothetical protein